MTASGVICNRFILSALYELLRQFLPLRKNVKQGKSNGLARDRPEYPELGAILGVREDRYRRFRDFRVNVVEVAQRELVEKTDLAFDFECLRKGRKVGAIKFIIRHNEQFESMPETDVLEGQQLPESVDEGMLSMVKMLMPEITDQDALLLMTGYDKAFLTEALMDYSRAAVKGEIKDPKGYLVGILKKKRQEDPARHVNTRPQPKSSMTAAGPMAWS